MRTIDNIAEFINCLNKVRTELNKDEYIIKISDIEVTVPINTNQIVNNSSVCRFFELVSKNEKIETLHFENCIFNDFNAIIVDTYEYKVVFEKCQFKGNVFLRIKNFNRILIINNCTFIAPFFISGEGDKKEFILNIEDSIFEYLIITSVITNYLYLNKNTFNDEFILDSSKSNNFITLEDCTFNSNISLEDIIVEELRLIKCRADKVDSTFRLSNIEGKINISDSKFISKVDFSNNKFNKNLNITADFRELFLHNSIFNDILNIRESNIEKIDLSSCYFNKKLNIKESELGEINFSNSHFNDTAKITLNSYNDNFNLDYSFSIFNSLFIIDSDSGKEKGDIINLKKEISFERSLISQDALILIRNVNSEDKEYKGTIDFNAANVLGTISLQSIKVEKIDLKDSTITGNINFEDVDFKEGNRKTYLKVKNELLKQNNKIDSLEYKSKELNHYLKEIDVKSKFYNNLYNSNKKSDWILGVIMLPLLLFKALCKKQSREVILLYINKLSNSFGQSWVRGVFFTLFIWIFYFCLYKIMGCYTFDIKYLNETLGEALSYFWLFGGLNELKDIKTMKFNISLLEIVPYILGKIFIAFGIYQTIAAFRKYGSK